MRQATYTPGPWKVTSYDSPVFHVDSKEFGAIANVFPGRTYHDAP